jgi:hypothetical protein
MPSSVYVETSVISYYTARSSRDIVTAARQTLTQEWWQDARDRFDLYVSVLVSLATVHGMDFLLTWNFRHINNAAMKARIGTIIEAAGFESPVIVHPKS